jgi:hypothetical protein
MKYSLAIGRVNAELMSEVPETVPLSASAVVYAMSVGFTRRIYT